MLWRNNRVWLGIEQNLQQGNQMKVEAGFDEELRD